MASIIERSGAFRATVRVPGGGRKTATFDTRPEAEAWAKSMERKKAVGLLTPHSGSKVTVADLLEAYEGAVSSRTDSAHWNAYRISKWYLDPLAKLLLQDVTTHHINEWMDRRGESVSAATVNREMNLLSGAFTYAVKDRRWLTVNPCHGARRPEKAPARNRRLLTPTELKAISVASGYTTDTELVTFTARVGACFLFALETGMRSGEILRLRPDDYNPDGNFVRVRAEEKGGRKATRSGRAAGRHGRDVPLTKRATELIEQLKLRRPEGEYLVGLTDRQRDALWRKIVKRAGVEDLHFHDTKHEAATRLSKFLDVFALSHAIGTKNLRLLRDVYYVSDASTAAKLLPASLAA